LTSLRLARRKGIRKGNCSETVLVREAGYTKRRTDMFDDNAYCAAYLIGNLSGFGGRAEVGADLLEYLGLRGTLAQIHRC
jgi:hypothetical protein